MFRCISILVLQIAWLGSATVTADEPCRLATFAGRHTFGYSLAFAGQRIAIVADSTHVMYANSVLLLERDGPSWTELVEIGPAGQVPFDGFASRVAMDGDFILAGSPQAPFKGTFSGAGHVFRWNQGRLTEWKLLPADLTPHDKFGFAVAVDRDLAVLGAPGDLVSRGSAYVYRFDGANWKLEAKLAPTTTTGAPQFGYSVGVSGDIIVIGAYTDDEKGQDAGAAYAFERNGSGAWVAAAKLLGDAINGHDFFGQAVAVSGETIIVGSPGFGSVDDPGGVFVFERVGGTWIETATLGGATGGLGFSVAIDGDLAAVTALSEATFFEYGNGAVYVHSRLANGRWQQVAKLFAAEPRQFDAFGWALDLDGNYAAASTFNNDATKPPQPDYVSVYAVGPDANNNGLMDPCECPGDLNKDWIVDQADLGLLLQDWGCVAPKRSEPCLADLDGDGQVGQSDLGILLKNYGEICP